MSRRDIALLAACALPLLVVLACGDDGAGGGTPSGGVTDGAATGEGGPNGGGDGAASADGPDDGTCDPTKSFARIVPLTTLNTAGSEIGPTLSQDEKTIIFARNKEGGPLFDFFIATRPNRSAPFGSPTPLGAPNEEDADERMPSLSADGLSLYYQRAKDGPYDIYVSKRAAIDQPFGAGVPFAIVNSAIVEASPALRADAKVLYLVRDAVDEVDSEIYVSTSGASGFVAPTLVAELSTTGNEWAPVPTPDGLGLFFGRSLGSGDRHIWLAKRAAPSGPFTQVAKVDELASGDQDDPAWISEDGCRLYFTSNRPGGGGSAEDIWIATRGK